MSAAATGALRSAAASSAGVNPWLIAVLVAFASFMENLDTTIANVALPYIAGGMGVSEDEASWVITTYLVANAVSLTASSFLAQRLGRKSFFLICLALFTASSVLCGFAPNLQALLLFRIAARPRRRRHGAGCAIDSGGFVSAGKAWPGFRVVRHRGRRGAGGRPDARRLDFRQLVLAMVL